MAQHENPLPYRELVQGTDYWIKDNILPDPDTAARRCFTKPAWILGSPWRNEPWPGLRAPDALTPDELIIVEQWVLSQVPVKALRAQDSPTDGVSGHNHAQLVGGADAAARPHVDSSSLCDYAAVLYLHPFPPTKHSGTSFFRHKLPDGTLGGNYCPKPYESLTQIPNMQQSDLGQWEEDLEVPNLFNRLLVYKSDIIHSATAYFGFDHEVLSKRLTVVFFWKTVS